MAVDIALNQLNHVPEHRQIFRPHKFPDQHQARNGGAITQMGNFDLRFRVTQSDEAIAPQRRCCQKRRKRLNPHLVSGFKQVNALNVNVWSWLPVSEIEVSLVEAEPRVRI